MCFVFHECSSLSFVSCTSFFFLVGPAWAYCPARPFSPFLFALCTFPSLFSFLPLGLSPSLVLGFSVTLVSLCALFQFSPICGQPGHTVRLATPLPLLRPFFSSSASLSFLPFLVFFPFLKVFAQSGFAQRGNILWPKAVFSSHVVSLFAGPPTLCSRLPIRRLCWWCRLRCWLPVAT